jgi:hypothetical protein
MNGQLNTAPIVEENNELGHATRESVQYPTWILSPLRVDKDQSNGCEMNYIKLKWLLNSNSKDIVSPTLLWKLFCEFYKILRNRFWCIIRLKLLIEDRYINFYSVFIPRYFLHETLWILNNTNTGALADLGCWHVYLGPQRRERLRRRRDLSFPQILLPWLPEGF